MARAIWADGLQLPSWEGGDTWVHADLMPGNLLTKDGRLTAVIDFESAGVGDPACDLIVAWMLLPAQVRPTFKRAIGADDATWLRGRARALSMALGHIPYYKAHQPGDGRQRLLRGQGSLRRLSRQRGQTACTGSVVTCGRRPRWLS